MTTFSMTASLLDDLGIKVEKDFKEKNIDEMRESLRKCIIYLEETSAGILHIQGDFDKKIKQIENKTNIIDLGEIRDTLARLAKGLYNNLNKNKKIEN